MKNQDNKKYIKLGITGVAVIVISMLFFFLLFRLQEVTAGLVTITDILTPFFYGAAIAYILAPVCNKMEGLLIKIFRPSQGRNGIISGVSIALALALALVLIWILVMLVIPQVWNSIVGIANAIPKQLVTAQNWLHNLLETKPELQNYWDDIFNRASSEIEGWLSSVKIEEWLKTDFLPSMGTVINELGSQLAVFFTIIKNLFLGILISAYFLASRKKFAAQGKMLLNGLFPRRLADLIEEEVKYADRMFNGFLMGKLLDSAIIGMICFIGTTLLGFKSAALISVIVGVTNIVPFFGPFIGAIPCAILLLLENPMHCVYFLIFVVVLQQLDGNLIGPKILGNTTGLSSFWVLFSILLFGGLWGILGMIVGVPLFAVIYDIIRRLIIYGLHKHEQGNLIEAYQKTFYPEPVAKETKKPKPDRKKNKS